MTFGTNPIRKRWVGLRMQNENARKILIILVFIFAIFVMINVNAHKPAVAELKVLKVFVLPELAREAFSSWPNFRMFMKAKLAFDPIFKYLIFGVLATIGLLIFTVIRKRRNRLKPYEFEHIFERVNYILDETADSGKRDENGKVIFEDVKIMPELDFSTMNEDHTFIINNIHPKLKSNVKEFLPGLLKLLKEEEHIPVEQGVLENTGFPGQMRVVLLTPERVKQHKLESVFNKSGLYFKETVGDKTSILYPKITELENGNLIVDVSGVNITKSQIERAIPDLSKDFDRNYLFITNKSGSIFEIHCAKPMSLSIPKGQPIVKNFKKWMDGPVKKLKDKWEKEKKFYWYLGELRDASYNLEDNDIIVSADDLPHMMIIGSTGSGKTESLKTMCVTLKAAYGDDVEFYFANGGQSSDLDALCGAYSPLGKDAAKLGIGDQDEAMSRLLNILTRTYSMMNDRVKTFEAAAAEHGVECKSISDYRNSTGNRMTEVVIAIDEFAGYSNLFDYETNFGIQGTIAYYFQFGFAQYRKYGIHFLLATQEMRAKSIPRRLMNNITGGLIMRIVDTEVSYMQDNFDFSFEGHDPTRFARGDGLAYGPSLQCRLTQKYKMPISMPWIGKDASELVKLIGGEIDSNDKEEYDTEILQLTEKELTIGGLDAKKKKLQLAIEKCFLKREGWEITEKESTSHKIIHLHAVYDGDSNPGDVIVRGTSLRVGFATSEEIIMENFRDRLDMEGSPDADLTVFFIISKNTPKQASDILEKLLIDSSTIVQFQTDYYNRLAEAHAFLRVDNMKPIFKAILNRSSVKNKLKAEREINNLYSSKIGPDVVTIKLLDKIRKGGNSSEKGAKFEDLFMAMEKADNHNSMFGRELIYRKIITVPTANAQADLGVDIVRWINFEERRCWVFQLKNQISKPLDPTVVDKMVKSKQIYMGQGIDIEKFFLITTGDITAQARSEAEELGFIVINGEQLESMIYKMDSVNKIKVEDFDKSISSKRQKKSSSLIRGLEVGSEETMTKSEFKQLKTKPDVESLPKMIKKIPDLDAAIDSDKDEQYEDKGDLNDDSDELVNIETGELLSREEAGNSEGSNIMEIASAVKSAKEKERIDDEDFERRERELNLIKKLNVSYHSKEDFLRQFEEVVSSKALTTHQKRLVFNDLTMEYLKLKGFKVSKTSDLENAPKGVDLICPLIYTIDKNRVGVVVVRNNATRGFATDKIPPIVEALRQLEGSGFVIARKEIYLSGVCFISARTELERSGFDVYAGDVYRAEVALTYNNLSKVKQH